MNINDPRIEQYLDNELTDKELKSFLKELDQYPEVKEYVQFKSFVIEGIQSEGKEELKEYIRTRVQDESSDSQTNLWLYSVATVTLMLVSYFFINQYIRTGSFKEATEVMSFKREPVPPQKSKYQLPNIGYTTPVITSADSTIVADDVIDGNSDSTQSGLATGYPNYKWSFGDNGSSDKGAATSDDAPPAAVSPSEAKPFNSAKTHFVNSVTLVPINQIASVSVNLTSTESPQKTKAFSKKLKNKMSADLETEKIGKAEETHTSDSLVLADVRTDKNAAITNYSKVIVQMFEGSVDPEIKTEPNGTTLVVSISNISAMNPLVYVLNNKYYLEIGPKLIYELPKTKTTIQNPKPITDKAIIKAIQN